MAAIATVEAVERIVMYFGFDHRPRMKLEPAVLPELKDLFLRAITDAGAKVRGDTT